jgi:uncharacterized protein YndB with AHSA1/START domain
MPGDYAALLEDRIDIDAPVARVWDLVSDIRRMVEWSPQVDSCEYDGEQSAGVGARFTNHNSHEELRWTTHGEIVRFVPGQEVAFRIDENRVVWAFRLEPGTSGGTALMEQRTTPEGISEYSLRLTDTYLGGQETFTAVMRQGMRQTLERIKTAAERAQ